MTTTSMHRIDCETVPHCGNSYARDMVPLSRNRQPRNRVRGQIVYDQKRIRVCMVDEKMPYRYMDRKAFFKTLSDRTLYTAHMLNFLMERRNQHLIPNDWKDKCVYFPGTVYSNPFGTLYMEGVYLANNLPTGEDRVYPDPYREWWEYTSMWVHSVPGQVLVAVLD